MPDNNVLTIKALKDDIIQLPSVMLIAESVMKKSTNKIKGYLSLTTLAGGALLQTMKQLTSFVSSSFQKTAHFEGLQISMEVLLGSADKAEQRIKELSRFTKGTTFELPEVVQASTELQSLGKYSQGTLTMLGNLAIGSGKSLGEVTKAYSGLAGGQHCFFHGNHLSFSLLLSSITKFIKYVSCIDGSPTSSPIKGAIINPINVNNKQPKRYRTITKTEADKPSYLIQLITNTISSTRYEKNFTYFIIGSTVKFIINLISYFKIRKIFDFVNLKMRVVCQ